jgi:integrase/recombinase XerD
MDRGKRGEFHPWVYRHTGHQSIAKALNNHQITEDDAALIHEFVGEVQATRHISDVRKNKYYFTLVGIRRFLDVPYRTATLGDVYAAIDRIKSGTTAHGKPFKQNTVHDFVMFLKMFIAWLIENGYSTIDEKKIRQVKVPPVLRETKRPEDLLSPDEVLKITGAATNSRDRAFLWVLYESGCRAKEIARARWRDMIFDQWGVKFYIRQDVEKTGKPRYTRLIKSTSHLDHYRNDCKDTALDAYVFMTYDGYPLSYNTVAKIVKKAVARAGVDKRVTPHLFRHSRITHLIKENHQESIIKEMMWNNVNTDMFRTYVRLHEQDIDDEMLKKAGLSKKDAGKDVLASIPCPNCHYVNAPDARRCNRCGHALTQEEIDLRRAMLHSLLEHPEILMELQQDLRDLQAQHLSGRPQE